MQDVSCCGRCDVSKLAMLCVKGKRECVAPRLRACARTEPETVGNRRLSHNNATHRRRTCPYRAQARRKRISLAEFLTLLRLLNKKAL